MKKFGAFAVLLLATLIVAGPAWAANVVVTPSSVTPGGSVSVTGTVPIPGCPLRGTVLVLDPFKTGRFGAAAYSSTGHFSVRISVPSNADPGTYGVGARCVGPSERLAPGAGAELGGPFPTVTVVGLPRTGGSIGPLSDIAAAALGLALVAVGSTAVLYGRHRGATPTA
jgi:hypothetical protein